MKRFLDFLNERNYDSEEMEKEMDRKEYGATASRSKSKENYDKKERKYRVGFMKDKTKSDEAKKRSKERRSSMGSLRTADATREE